MFLICQVTSTDHLTEESCKFMGGSSSRYVTTLTSLMTISIVIVHIFCFVTWPHMLSFVEWHNVTTCGKIYVNIRTVGLQWFTPLPCLVVMSLAQVENIQLLTSPHKTTWLKDHVTLWVGAHHHPATFRGIGIALV